MTGFELAGETVRVTGAGRGLIINLSCRASQKRLGNAVNGIAEAAPSRSRTSGTSRAGRPFP